MKRDASFDIMKGIGILAVIAGHSAGQLTFDNALTWKLIYSFHMPMFFIIAGYFYKKNYNIGQKLKGDFKRLIIPYIITSITFLLYQLLTDESFYSSYKYILIAIIWGSGESHTSAIWPKMPYIGAIWFLLALFWCRTFFNLITLHIKRPYLAVVTIAIMATFTDRYLINLPLGILPGLSAMSFYLIGYCIHRFKINKYAVIACFTCWIIYLLYSRIDMCNCYYKYYPIDVLGTTFGAYVAYLLSKKISLLPYSKSIALLGQVSLVVLCFHTLEKNIINYKCVPVIEQNWILLFIVRTTLCIFLTIIWYRILHYTKLFSSHLINKR